MSEGDNGKELKEEIKLKYFINIGIDEKDGFIFQSNVPNYLVGFGMLEMAKRGVEVHISNLNKPNIIKPTLLDKVRRGFR